MMIKHIKWVTVELPSNYSVNGAIGVEMSEAQRPYCFRYIKKLWNKSERRYNTEEKVRVYFFGVDDGMIIRKVLSYGDVTRMMKLGDL